MSIEQIFGWLGALFCTIILVPQIIKAFKTKHTTDLSMMMLVFSALGNAFWGLHGAMTENVPLLASASLIMTMSFVLIIYKYKNEKQ